MLESRANPDHPGDAAVVPQRLGDLLVANKLITRAQLEEAEAERQASGEFLCKVLVQKNLITQSEISTCFVKICKIPHISLLDYEVGAEVLKLVPSELCLKHGLIPIDKLGRILTVAMVDPLDTEALDIVRDSHPELKIKPILCNWAHFEQAARKYFTTASDDNDRESASMASFGLSRLPAKPAAAPIDRTPARPAAPPAPEAGQSGLDTQALISAIQSGLRGVVEEIAEASLVRNERVQSLPSGRPSHHQSVSPFGMASQSESDDDAARAGDEQVRSALVAEVPLQSLTFDTFFSGTANTFTVKVGQSVAESPGDEYNPFFLFGNVGLGKTHLISAIGNRIQTCQPHLRVGYVSASHFSRRLKEALAAHAQEAFRENYCHWDVLILDDIQFLGGRIEAQEEFFHIFNVLHQQGRQIIIASDKAPDRLGLLEQRLISRFSSGIVAELKPPEWETRMRILKHHIAATHAKVSDEICSLIAMRVPNDVRKMVGSLRKVVAFAALLNEQVTVEMATEILSHISSEEAA